MFFKLVPDMWFMRSHWSQISWLCVQTWLIKLIYLKLVIAFKLQQITIAPLLQTEAFENFFFINLKKKGEFYN